MGFAVTFGVAALACCARMAQAIQESPSRPPSAIPAWQTNDPTGRGHLLEALGNPPSFYGSYPYTFVEGQFGIDPTYDPATELPSKQNNPAVNGSWRVIGSSGLPAIHALPFSTGETLFLSRFSNYLGGGNTAETNPQQPNVALTNDTGIPGEEESNCCVFFNDTTAEVEPLFVPASVVCSGNTLLPNGTALIVGGVLTNSWLPFQDTGAWAVQTVDPVTHVATRAASLDRARWYPTLSTLPDGNVVIVGGAQAETGGWGITTAPSTSVTLPTACSANQGGGWSDPYWNNPSFTIYDVATNTMCPSLALTILMEGWPINTYPQLFLLPTGSTLVISGSLMEALFFTCDGATSDPQVSNLPAFPVPLCYPQWGSTVLLPLFPETNYQAQILAAGGSSEECANAQTPAGTTSWLMDASANADHTLQAETLNFPRVMGDLVLLPDGKVIFLNGAEIGIAGGGGPNFSNADVPATTPELYDPAKPVGKRWTILADSQINRMYHSTAVLTQNAEVLVAGSETTAELRVQLYTPYYLQNGLPRPVITSAPATVSLNQTFAIGFSGVSTIDRVVLHRVATSTHGIHADQRQVVLACSAASPAPAPSSSQAASPSGPSTISCTAPPSSNIAPPGLYFLFALLNGVPSVAEYLSVLSATGTMPTSTAG